MRNKFALFMDILYKLCILHSQETSFVHTCIANVAFENTPLCMCCLWGYAKYISRKPLQLLEGGPFEW